MTLEERLRIMREFTARSDQEFDGGGNSMVAAELLWGVLAQGLIATAKINGWRCEGHSGYRAVARMLAEKFNLQRWLSDVASGEHLHSHFYQRYLPTRQLVIHRAAAKAAVERLISLLNATQSRQRD